MSNNTNETNKDQNESVDTSSEIESTSEEKTEDSHTVEVPETKSEEADMEKEDNNILFPSVILSELNRLDKDFASILPENFQKIYEKTQEHKKALAAVGLITGAERMVVQKGVFEKELNAEDIVNYVNMLKFGDKDLNTRPLPINMEKGPLNAETAVARFTAMLGVGEIIQVPLWHSGFWITIKPPKNTDILNLEISLTNAQVSLGRETNTLIYSNYSVIFNRIVTDFIMDHVISVSIKLPDDKDVRDYIVVHDLYPLVLGMITAMHPSGIDVTRSCINASKLDENKIPLCDFNVSARLDTKKLLWVNRKALTTKMLNQMSIRQPNGVTVDEVKEYQNNITQILSETIEVETANGSSVKLVLNLPMLRNYIDNGERWVNRVISKAEELFTTNDSYESKNSKVNDVLLSVILGIYNVFITKIELNGEWAEDEDAIYAVLDVLSSDEDAFNVVIDKIKHYISKSAIAMVATPNYECPTCQKDQAREGVPAAFKELIPLNILEGFFDLSVLKIKVIRARNI
jgi:hypothetical protein